MKNLGVRRFSSVRVRLTLWNTFTFALVLVTLGAMFRFFAQNYLLDALDREIRTHARPSGMPRQTTAIVVGDGDTAAGTVISAPKMSVSAQGRVSIRFQNSSLPPAPPPGFVGATTATGGQQYAIIKRIDAYTADPSGQFQQRTFDRTGKPFSPMTNELPLHLGMLGKEGFVELKQQPETYLPWDQSAFQRALGGHEGFSSVECGGERLRVFSQPLREGDTIRGVTQIATPLGSVNRDIAGLTRMLLLTLPLALLVAAGTGVFLTDRALRPVKSLTHAATRIRPDQLAQRLPVSGADEFDTLASTFNHALDRVELAFLEREKMMEQLRRFTGDASHELRTPLTTIKANTGVALAELQPSQEHLHALRQIDLAADRMTSLVQDLLLLARSDANQIPLTLHPISLPDIAAEAVEMLPPSDLHPPITLYHSEGDLIVPGDADQLRRLLRNLLENATRYTPPEGAIQITCEQLGAWVVIQVRDTGCGIAPEHLPHLGERFYRADTGRNRKHGGAGLGLAICHSIVAQHKGALSIESQLGHGTTVTVRLPVFS